MALIVLGLNGFSQPFSYDNPVEFIAPTSPEASSLGTYGQFELSLNSGSYSIPIELGRFAAGNIDFPVSISYSMGINTAKDISSQIGLGWSLHCGGTITINVAENYDINEYSLTNTPSIINQALIDGCEIRDLNQDPYIVDGTPCYGLLASRMNEGDHLVHTPDVINFDFLGRNGRAVFLSNGKISTIPTSDLRIEFNTQGGMTIIDEKGTEYIFNKHSSSRTVPFPIQHTPRAKRSLTNQHSYVYSLTEVRDVYGNSVTLQYQTTPEYFYKAEISHINPILTGYPLPPYYCEPFSIPTESGATQYNTTDYCTSIQSNFGFSVILSRDNIQRLDLKDNYALKEISISYNGSTYANATFYNSYFGCNSSSKNDFYTSHDLYKLKLDSLKVQYVTYKFEYYDSQLLPARLTYRTDHFGYYNGVSQSSTAPASLSQSEMASRAPNLLFAQLGLLKSIVFPTKGKKTFEYELHTFQQGGIVDPGTNVPKLGNGVRVKSITESLDGAQTLSKSLYKYDVPSTSISSGRTMEYSYRFFGHSGIWYLEGPAPTSPTQLPPEPSTDACKYEGYTTSHPILSPFLASAGVTYEYVLETVESMSSNDKHSVLYRFNNSPPYFLTEGSGSYTAGEILYEAHYSGGTVDTNQLVYKKEYIYAFIENEYVYSFKAFMEREQRLQGVTPGVLQPAPALVIADISFNWNRYNIGKRKMVREMVTTYDQLTASVFVQSQTDYQYGTNHNSPTQVSYDIGNGRKIIRRYQYPKDYVNIPPNDPSIGLNASNINLLVFKNIVSSPVETSYLLSADSSEKLLFSAYLKYARNTDWKFLPSEVFLLEPSYPLKISSFQPSSYSSLAKDIVHDPSYLSELKFLQYDPIRGSLTLSKDKSGLSQKYNWGYYQTKVISMFESASETDFVLFSGFENQETGNWSVYTGSTFVNPSSLVSGYFGSTPFAGLSSFQLATLNSTHLVSSVSVPSGYIVSFWAQGNGKVYLSLGANTFYSANLSSQWSRHSAVVPSTGIVKVYTDQSSGVLIDELRAQPKQALVQTFSYRPEAGVSDMVDSSGNRVSFEYDSNERLWFVKDPQGSIERFFNYKFKY
ncbi:MAG: hypothetical protein SFY70_04260 [Bacteroidia bacterium]|nr:hypothetical protein [Bacteroidia bacterium]